MSEAVEKSCINCIHSNGEFEGCYCLYKGNVDALSSCRKYKLDLLKIKPRPPINLNTDNIAIEEI